MGLHIHNLGNLPADSERDYFIYMLDYGWHEPLAEAMRANFTNMARLASKTKSVVVAGVDPVHFENEVFSYHGINGESADEILPALMVTTLHPRYFKENNRAWRENREIDDKLLLHLLHFQWVGSGGLSSIPPAHRNSIDISASAL